MSSTDRKITKSKNFYIALASKLDAMSPLKVLARGFSIAETESGNVVKSVSDVKSGDKIAVKVADGRIDCTVD